jgi:meso-butanediol dehydrogenase / (S,S)-butanediol dehydrogenase / diacetyl reductase
MVDHVGLNVADLEAMTAWSSGALGLTTNTAQLLADPPEKFQRVVLDRLPLGRPGQPQDVVNAAIFLASDESSWISGANIVVDGGGSALG